MLDPIWSYISLLRKKELILDIIMITVLCVFIGIGSFYVVFDQPDYNLTTEGARADNHQWAARLSNLTTEGARADNHQWAARLRKDDVLSVSCPDGYLISADLNKLIYDGMLVIHCEMMEEECQQDAKNLLPILR